MSETTRKTLIAAVGIVLAGSALGLVNNLVAGESRRLDWVGTYPPKGEPACRQYVPPGASGATGATGEASATGEAATTGETGEAASTAAAPTGTVEPIEPVPADKQWAELHPEQVKSLYDQGVLFIDARRTSTYAEGHVQGAISIPIWESGVDEKVAQVIFNEKVAGDPGKPIVVYCGGGDCEDSHMLGVKLWTGGHSAVYVYKDGWPNWSDHGWPSSVGEAP